MRSSHLLLFLLKSSLLRNKHFSRFSFFGITDLSDWSIDDRSESCTLLQQWKFYHEHTIHIWRFPFDTFSICSHFLSWYALFASVTCCPFKEEVTSKFHFFTIDWTDRQTIPIFLIFYSDWFHYCDHPSCINWATTTWF